MLPFSSSHFMSILSCILGCCSNEGYRSASGSAVQIIEGKLVKRIFSNMNLFFSEPDVFEVSPTQKIHSEEKVRSSLGVC